jgi:FMN phosphatase YigB (HAD superfamily)
MRNALWLFFDLGNTLVNEETAAECRIQRLFEALARYRGRCSFDEVRSAFQEASAEFAPHLSTRAIEKLLADPAGRRAVAAEARYPRNWRSFTRGSASCFGCCPLLTSLA